MVCDSAMTNGIEFSQLESVASRIRNRQGGIVRVQIWAAVLPPFAELRLDDARPLLINPLHSSLSTVSPSSVSAPSTTRAWPQRVLHLPSAYKHNFAPSSPFQHPLEPPAPPMAGKKQRCQFKSGEQPCSSAAIRIVGDCPHCEAHFCGQV